jgi:hypothetical protein
MRHVMPDASAEEIAEATENWFDFLQTLLEIVEARENKQRNKGYSQ